MTVKRTPFVLGNKPFVKSEVSPFPSDEKKRMTPSRDRVIHKSFKRKNKCYFFLRLPTR